MIMNIGANGPGIYFSKYLGLKLQSPIDNMQCYNFKSILNIFDGSLFNAILNDKIDHKHYREIENIQKTDEDNVIRYYCTTNAVFSNNYSFPTIEGNYNWRTLHHNFETDYRKLEFKRRISLFNEFSNNLKEDDFYLYTIAYEEDQLTENEFYETLEKLPKYVIDHLLIFYMNNKIPSIFLNNFNCMSINKFK